MSPRSKQPPEEQARKILVEAQPSGGQAPAGGFAGGDTPRSARLDCARRCSTGFMAAFQLLPPQEEHRLEVVLEEEAEKDAK